MKKVFVFQVGSRYVVRRGGEPCDCCGKPLGERAALFNSAWVLCQACADLPNHLRPWRE
jgi:hypothetical protein